MMSSSVWSSTSVEVELEASEQQQHNQITSEQAENESENNLLAKVWGEAVTEFPQDLYIPPDALEVILEAFQGPLDLLLYLIRRQNLDILDIPIAEITQQYMQYIDMMRVLRLELAAEYLVMAAMLAEIKSRMLLPRQVEEATEEGDPRAELIRRLQEYERFKQAAENIDALPRVERDILMTSVLPPDMQEERPIPSLELKELILAFQDVLKRMELNAHHQIKREALSIRERMSIILNELNEKQFVDFYQCFKAEEGRMGVVVTFIAILELLKQSLIEIVQAEAFGRIHVKRINE